MNTYATIELAMTAIELKETLLKAMPARLPILIKGAPGCGKTDIVTQVKDELKWDLILSHPVVSNPTDARGLGAIVEGEACFLPYGDLRRAMNVKKPTIWFLDDLGQAPAAVQAAFMQLILGREINGHKISDKIVFVAATNRRQDKAGVTSILEPVKSRFASIIELTPDVASWVAWAIENALPPELIGFIQMRPDLLNTGEATNDIVNHPCPRTWAFVGKLLNAGLDNLKVIAGAVGVTAATEFVGFLRIYNNIPNMEQILLDPENTMIPADKELAAMNAICSALVEHATIETVSQMFVYVTRLPKEFQTKFVKTLRIKLPDAAETTGYINWAIANEEALT